MYTTRNSNKNLILNCNQTHIWVMDASLVLILPKFPIFFLFFFLWLQLFIYSMVIVTLFKLRSISFFIIVLLHPSPMISTPCRWCYLLRYHSGSIFFWIRIFFLEPFISPDVINVAISNHITQIDGQPAHIYLLRLCRICQCVHGCCTCVATDDHVISLIPCAQRLGTITMPIAL